MGMDPVTMALGATSTVANTVGNIRSNSYNAHLQEEQNALNRQYNAEEAEKQRAWSTNERLAVQAYNTSERQATQQWNSPQHMMQMQRSAGLNPAVYGQGTTSAAASSPQSSSPGSASPASLSTGASVMNMPQLMSGMSDMIVALSKTRETEATLPLIGAQVENWLKQNVGQDITNELLSIQRDVQKSNMPNDIKRSVLEVANLEVAIELSKNENEKKKAETKLVKLKQKTEKKLAKLHGYQAIINKIEAENIQNRIDAQLDLLRSQKKSNEASAYKTTQEGKTVESMRPHQVTSQIIENGIKGVDFDIKNVTSDNAKQQIKDEAARIHRYLKKGEFAGRYLPEQSYEVRVPALSDIEDYLWDKYNAYEEWTKGAEERLKSNRDRAKGR